MKQIYTFFLIFIVSTQLLGQSTGSIIINADVSGQLYIDADFNSNIEANQAKKLVLESGEHLLQLKYSRKTKNETITIETGKQKILNLLLNDGNNVKLESSPKSIEPISVANLNMNLAGVLTVSSWNNQNPGKQYHYPTYYYAFEKGDEIILNCDLLNAKGTNEIIISTFPNNAIKYSNTEFRELNNIRIKVAERSIYKFTLKTNHILDRKCDLNISRIPESEKTVDFNPNVKRGVRGIAKTIIDKEQYFINSGSNATFKGGTSRVIVPVDLPENTIEWYYVFSASRDKNEIDRTSQELKLTSELATMLLNIPTGGIMGKATNIAVDNLTKPPGSNYCDIYLLDGQNQSLFQNKLQYKYFNEGTRENLASGLIKLTDFNKGIWYIGIKNPDNFYGVHAVLQVVAIVLENEITMEQQ